MAWNCVLQTVDDTRRLGAGLAAVCVGGEVVALRGGLGAGKTCFAQGVGAGLGVEGPVASPTFILVAEYPAPVPLLHADLYRLEPAEVAGIGLEEQLETWPGVALVEWAERCPDALPLAHLELALEVLPDGSRRATIGASVPELQPLVDRWRAAHEAGDA